MIYVGPVDIKEGSTITIENNDLIKDGTYFYHGRTRLEQCCMLENPYGNIELAIWPNFKDDITKVEENFVYEFSSRTANNEIESARVAKDGLPCVKCGTDCKSMRHLCRTCEYETIDTARIIKVKDDKCQCSWRYRTSKDMYTIHHVECEHFNDSLITVFCLNSDEQGLGAGFENEEDAKGYLELNYQEAMEAGDIIEIIEYEIHKEIFDHLGEPDW